MATYVRDLNKPGITLTEVVACWLTEWQVEWAESEINVWLGSL
jgi:hypothetical protein